MTPFSLVAFAGTDPPTPSCGCGGAPITGVGLADWDTSTKVKFVLGFAAGAGLIWWCLKDTGRKR